MKHPRLGLLLWFFALGAAAHAQLIQWNTFGNLGTETTEPSVFNNSLLLSSSLSLGSGVTGTGNANRFGGQNWFDTGEASPSTLANAVIQNDYIEFTVTPTSGAQFTPTSLVFSWEHSATGPGSLALRSSADAFGSDLGVLTGIATGIQTGNSITISGLSDISSALTFRLYGFDATGTTGAGGFDTASNVVNVQLNGTASAIPEPSAYAAILGGVALVGALVRRRARAVAAALTGRASSRA